MTMQTRQSPALPVAENASWLATSEKIVSKGVDGVFVFSASTDVNMALLFEAERLIVDPLCTAFILDLWVDHGFLRRVCGLIVKWFVLLDDMSCLCNYTRDEACTARSCEAAFFLSP